MKRLLQNLSIKTKIGLIVLLPLCGYLITSALNLLGTYHEFQSAENIISMVEFDGRISLLVHELQKERGASSGFLASKGQRFVEILKKQRQDTDQKAADYNAASNALRAQPVGLSLTDNTNQINSILQELSTIRQKISSQQIEGKSAIAYYTSLIKTLLDTISVSSHFSNNPDITSQLFAYVNFLQSKERAGIERAVISGVFSHGSFTTTTYNRFQQLMAAQENYLAAFVSEATPETRKFYDNIVKGEAVDEVERMRQVALNVGLDQTRSFGVDPEIWFKTITAKINLLKKVDDGLAEHIIASARTEAQAKQKKLIFILFSFIIILGLSLVFMVLTSLSLIKGLKKATAIALDLAEGDGDLTKRMGFTSKDEIGVLGRGIDKLLNTLGNMIGQVQNSGTILGNSGEELTTLASQMEEASSDIQNRANGVAAAAEEMSINMNTVAAAVEEAATNVTTVAAATGSIAEAGMEIADNAKKAQTMTDEAVTRTRSSYELISDLGSAAQEIGKVTETIATISTQTNLLALNATIEAARAGDAGKGFAVVANEIKALARQTAEATVEINARIQRIQNSTDKSVSEIEEILQVINRVDSIVDDIAAAVENQAATTSEIAENIDQASIGIQDVANNVSQVSSVSSEVAQDIAKVSYSSQELADNSDRVRHSAEELNKMTRQLREVTDRFKV
ncbi:MAG: nitrate- and nitrite sensing domain-containing protein [Deltaproteobacteria bacterium]|nr:nitrate- and nitrite sensing domain-containing protein [Deltaproteobacteria bacterium]